MSLQTEFIAKTEKFFYKEINNISNVRKKKISVLYNISKVVDERNKENKNMLSLADFTTYELLKKKNCRKISINVRIKEIIHCLRLAGFIHYTKNKASSNVKLNFLRDDEVIKKYNLIIYGLLN